MRWSRKYNAYAPEGGGVGHAAAGGNARNRVCRLSTDTHTTQGQAAFGHDVQAIITYYFTVKTSCNMIRCTRIFNARRTHLLRSSNSHKMICYAIFYFANYPGIAEPQYQVTPIQVGSPPETTCAGFVDICLPILHSY